MFTCDMYTSSLAGSTYAKILERKSSEKSMRKDGIRSSRSLTVPAAKDLASIIVSPMRGDEKGGAPLVRLAVDLHKGPGRHQCDTNYRRRP